MQRFWTSANVLGQEKHSVVSIPFFYENCLKQYCTASFYDMHAFSCYYWPWLDYFEAGRRACAILSRWRKSTLNNQCSTQGWLQCIGDRAISYKPFPNVRWLHQTTTYCFGDEGWMLLQEALSAWPYLPTVFLPIEHTCKWPFYLAVSAGRIKNTQVTLQVPFLEVAAQVLTEIQKGIPTWAVPRLRRG